MSIMIKDDSILYKELAYEIVGCFYSVFNELGHGFKESIYVNALCLEFEAQHIAFTQQKRIAISYRNQQVGFYVPDFLINDQIIVEVKAVEHMPKMYETQLFNYLKGSQYKLGYMVNFGSSKIDIRRRIYETARY